MDMVGLKRGRPFGPGHPIPEALMARSLRPGYFFFSVNPTSTQPSSSEVANRPAGPSARATT